MHTPEKIPLVQYGGNTMGFGMRSAQSGQGVCAQQLCNLGCVKGDTRVFTSRDFVRIRYHSAVKQFAQSLAHSRQSVIVGYYFYYCYKLLLFIWMD